MNPMETAPKDGTEIDIWAWSNCFKEFERLTNAHWREGEWWADDQDYGDVGPIVRPLELRGWVAIQRPEAA